MCHSKIRTTHIHTLHNCIELQASGVFRSSCCKKNRLRPLNAYILRPSTDWSVEWFIHSSIFKESDYWKKKKIHLPIFFSLLRLPNIIGNQSSHNWQDNYSKIQAILFCNLLNCMVAKKKMVQKECGMDHICAAKQVLGFGNDWKCTRVFLIKFHMNWIIFNVNRNFLHDRILISNRKQFTESNDNEHSSSKEQISS